MWASKHAKQAKQKTCLDYGALARKPRPVAPVPLAPVAAVAQTDIATELLRAEVRFLNLQVQMLKMQLAHAGVALL